MFKNIKLNKVSFKGKYSFQYTENIEITNSALDTKDAFWHSKNVTVKDSILNINFYKNIFKGKYNSSRAFLTIVDIGFHYGIIL